MPREELKIRTQQAIDAIPVLRWRDDGWEQIDSILYEILTELDGSDWHTGTPSEGGLFLVHLKDGTYDIYEFGKEYKAWDIGFSDVVKWQKIEEKEDGREEG